VSADKQQARQEPASARADRRPETLRPHPQAELVPAMRPDEYAALRADIEQRGVQEPLAIDLDGTVIDGHHRLRAAFELGLASVPVRVIDPPDQVDYLLTAALQRRQLGESQRTALALKLQRYRQQRQAADRRRRANLRPNTEVATLPPRVGHSRDLLASLAGVSARTAQDVITVAEADRALLAQVEAGTLAANKAARQVRRARRYAEIGDAPPLPPGRFDLIYADPPWQLGEAESDFAPENHYPTLDLEAIKALPVPAADHAIVYLWAPSSLLKEAIEVIEAWGFDYKTGQVWVKPSIGLGRWVRHRHEHLLIGRRGGFAPPESEFCPDSVIEAPRGRHSAKPKRVYKQLERSHPNTCKLELFARGKPHSGWVAWGNEVEPK
jgi:N6-adenosine-specific RNA methylase IME4/ParB-like chromosome segregation protein Spo0J